MKELENLPAGLLTATEELHKLILENPGVPMLVFAGEDCNRGEWRWEACSSCHAVVGEFLDCQQTINEERCYTDRDEFKEDMENEYGDFDGSDAEFEQFIDDKMAEYEPYWKKVIILYVDN